ncbi:hypothetical protein MAHJHV55_17770 [Mycobacterium avium subsp. hominissuis]
MTRPRVRAADGSGELAIALYELFTSTEVLGKMAMEKMLAALSTRRYPVSLDQVSEWVAAKSSATSRSTASRRFVAMTETALAELLAADLSGLYLVVFMIRRGAFRRILLRRAVGIDIDIEGNKNPLALVEHSTATAH